MNDYTNSIARYYNILISSTVQARILLRRPLTFTEKLLYSHLSQYPIKQIYARGKDDAAFRPDRVIMQDATAQMALLQFMNAGRKSTAVPATVHCDHLIQACNGEEEDLENAEQINKEVYDFLRAACNQYGLGFWKPGAGIIHQIVLENYAFPGGMMVGADSHTPNAGGLGMIAVGVGGAEIVDVMMGEEWELKMPYLIGVKLTGQLSGWASAKDVILKLAGMLTVNGATHSVIEYFGEGAATLPATGKATICNMGAETGATASLFPYDDEMKKYLIATERSEVAGLADTIRAYLTADPDVEKQPERYYDRVIEINLSELQPYINGPRTPDAATPISEFAEKVRKNDYPQRLETGLIGSCTNSSYQDLSRAASLLRQAKDKKLQPAAPLIINPGSELIRRTAERDGLIHCFRQAGAILMANACGPCIGQWIRTIDDPERPNSIVTSFNRNYTKRVDGNLNTHIFIASPDMTVALALAGDLCFNPLTDSLTNEDGEQVRLDPPTGDTLPPDGFVSGNSGYIAPGQSTEKIFIASSSERLQRLAPFAPWDGEDLENMPLLIKTQGKCTTDHISMAGPWLQFRGHLKYISDNLLMGAVNTFNGQTNSVKDQLTGDYESVSAVAKNYQSAGLYSVIVAEENYGEGSSREHAAMEPRFLNVYAILAKSFARIHETNLKKQGLLALTFARPKDYDRIREDDRISIRGLASFAPGKPLSVILKHANHTVETISVNHTYNETQIAWFRAGSALNYNANKQK